MRLLNLGCGKRFREGWTNIDFVSGSSLVMAHDLSQGVPFENNSFDFVYHSHVLEHFTQEEGVAFIRECLRVLKPGGILRIAVPDLEKLARGYLTQLEKGVETDSETQAANHEWMVLLLIDQCTRHASGGEMLKFLQKPLLNTGFILETSGVEMQQILNEQANAKPRNKAATSTNCISVLTRVKRQIRNQLSRLAGKPPVLSATDQRALQVGKFRLMGEAHRWMYDRYSLGRLVIQNRFCGGFGLYGYYQYPGWLGRAQLRYRARWDCIQTRFSFYGGTKA